MPVRGFSHYNLRAPRPTLDRLRAFYCDVVGLTAGERPPFAFFGYWLYAGERPVLHLSEAAESEARALHDRAGTFDHAAFECDGRPEFERRLGELGIPFRVARVPQTRQVQLFLKDPCGNGVELNFGSEA
jgi:catechol-2,3-dioxygenase